MTVWPVFEIDPSGDTDLAAIGATLDAAQRAAEEYVDHRLTWEERNSIFDSQEYWVAYHDNHEYHTYEWDVTP